MRQSTKGFVTATALPLLPFPAAMTDPESCRAVRLAGGGRTPASAFCAALSLQPRLGL